MRTKLLIVDDVEINREILTDIFENDFDIIEADNGEDAINIIDSQKKDLVAVLLDIFMPKVNGIDVLRHMGRIGVISDIPVLMITTDDSSESENICLKIGATDFVRKPFSSSLVKTRVWNAVNLYSYKNHLEEKVRVQTEKLRATNHNIVSLLGNLVESRNLESGEHVQRVSKYTYHLALKMMELYSEYGLTVDKIDIIKDAAALHDVGKISISDTILLKPGKLTDEEFEIMKTHTSLGADYIKNVKGVWDDDYSATCYDIARYHHERWDGRGYPEHLKGDDIPISAQLVSIADVYDALISERCYKKAFSKEKAYDMIMNGECGNFSPKLLECFKECFPFGEVLTEVNV